MEKYVGHKHYDFAIHVYEGRDTADRVYDELHRLEDEGNLTIQEAAVFTRNDKGKVELHNKGYIAAKKGGLIGLGVGILLGGPVGGAVVGGLLGFARGGERRRLRETMRDRLGSNDSALAVVVEDVDWAAVQPVMDRFGGETVYTEVEGKSLATLDQMLQDDPELEEATAEELEVS